MMLFQCPECKKTYAGQTGYCAHCHIKLQPLTLIEPATISLKIDEMVLPSLRSLLFCCILTALLFALLP